MSSLNEPDRDKKDQHFSNGQNTSPTQIQNRKNDSKGKIRQSRYCNDGLCNQTTSIYSCLDVERKSIFSVLQQSYIPVSVNKALSPQPSVTKHEEEPRVELTSDIDTFEGDKLKKILQRSAIKSDPSPNDEDDSDSEPEKSLLIPLLALSAIAVLTLSLAGLRLCHARLAKEKGDTRPR